MKRQQLGAAMTPAFAEYQMAYSGVMDFFKIDIILTKSIPVVVDHLAKNDPTEYAQLAQLGTINPMVRDPEYMKRIILELIICRLVDHFKVYLCHVTENALSLNSQSITIDAKERKLLMDRYQPTTEAEFVTAAIIDRVDWLSDRSIQEFVSFFEKNLAITLNLDPLCVETVNECFATRNVIVHTRSRANWRYLKRVPKSTLEVGDFVPLSSEQCQRWSTAMGDLAENIDGQVLDRVGRDVFLKKFAGWYQDFMNRTKGEKVGEAGAKSGG